MHFALKSTIEFRVRLVTAEPLVRKSWYRWGQIGILASFPIFGADKACNEGISADWEVSTRVSFNTAHQLVCQSEREKTNNYGAYHHPSRVLLSRVSGTVTPSADLSLTDHWPQPAGGTRPNARIYINLLHISSHIKRLLLVHERFAFLTRPLHPQRNYFPM